MIANQGAQNPDPTTLSIPSPGNVRPLSLGHIIVKGPSNENVLSSNEIQLKAVCLRMNKVDVFGINYCAELPHCCVYSGT